MKRLHPEHKESFADEIDQLGRRTWKAVGEADIKYIKGLIVLQRFLEIISRVLMVMGFISLYCWVIAILCLSLSKILDNMEIGHNIMHGQYDWANDPLLNGKSYEWDILADADSWRRYHNYEHHTFTNVIGMDRDFGYGLFRLSHDLSWRFKNTWQIITFVALSVFFEWGVAYHELASERVFFGKPKQNSSLPITKKELKRAFFIKLGRQLFKDYVFFPLICWPVAGQVLLGNFLANVIRNLWTSTIIFCGHFTQDVHTFTKDEIVNESKSDWYYRQILGSSNIKGRRFFHIMTGHLSCQIEHHLFPDIPAWRYPAMAVGVEKICQKYQIPYNTGGFLKQYGTVVKRVLRFSFP